MARPRRRRDPRDPYTTDPRDPIEVLARLVGRTATPPGLGRGGVPLSDSDITGALGYMDNKLGAALAMSVAGRHDGLLGFIARRAYKRVLRSLSESRTRVADLHQGADRYRVRGVLVDVTEAMIWPERRQPMAQAAKAAKMRTGAYATLYRHVEALLEAELANARKDFKTRLWSDQLEQRGTSANETAAPQDVIYGVCVLRVDVDPWWPIVMRTGDSLQGIAASLRESDRDQGLSAAADSLSQVAVLAPGRRKTINVDAGGWQLLVLVSAW